MKIKIILKIFLYIFLFLLLFILFKKPSAEKDWTDDAIILPQVSISTSTIEVQQIRDWRYKKGEVVSKNFYSETFDPKKIKTVYFLLNPFGKWEGVGHTFFLFEFEDGKTVSISVEARREKGEDYGAIRGLFNNYEQWYTWGSAADLFSRRAVYHNEDLYMYPLLISQETGQGLFIDLAKQTSQIATHPRFYNTVFSNCTNVLADSANRVHKGSIPWTFARIFTGYSDNKLYELGLISQDESFDETFKKSQIDLKIKEMFNQNKTYSKEEFWNILMQRQ